MDVVVEVNMMVVLLVVQQISMGFNQIECERDKSKERK
jgi:hypothetical protein